MDKLHNILQHVQVRDAITDHPYMSYTAIPTPIHEWQLL